MLCDQNESVESRNFVDGIDFTRNDPCVWVVYPGGAAGDLLISIIDKHYLRTGCEYYGINDRGRVKMYTTDYEMIDRDILDNKPFVFDEQWFFNLADNLGQRHLNYSLLDQVIFGCHLHLPADINCILETFPQAKIINIYPKDKKGLNLIKMLGAYKVKNVLDYSILNDTTDYHADLVQHERVLNIPFGALFNDTAYCNCYNTILDFLELTGQLICFDYIKFYLSKQQPEIRNLLIEYSDSL